MVNSVKVSSLIKGASMRISINIGLYLSMVLMSIQLLGACISLEVENKTTLPITIAYTTKTGVNEVRIKAQSMPQRIVCFDDIKTAAVQEQGKLWTRVSLNAQIQDLLKDTMHLPAARPQISIEKEEKEWVLTSQWKTIE